MAQLTLDGFFQDACPAFEQHAEREYCALVNTFGDAPVCGDLPVRCTAQTGGVPHVETPIIEEYSIRLPVVDNYPGQFVYQLNHELAHLMLDPRRSNGAVEALAEAYTLHRLHCLAKEDGFFAKHEQCQIAETHDLINRSCGVTAVWAGESASRHLDGRDWRDDKDVDRGLVGLAALLLLKGPLDWRRLRGIAAKTVPSPAEVPEYTEDLPLVLDALDEYERAVLGRTGLWCVLDHDGGTVG
jgi:hypothetical protein